MNVEKDTNIDDMLIDLVEQSPLLYNTSDPDYKCIAKRLVYWRRIANKLGITAKTCQIKWKNIRYNYFKARKDNVDLREAFRHKRFTRRLEFLDNIPLLPKKQKVKKLKIDYVDPVKAESPRLSELNFQDYYKLNIQQKNEEPLDHSQSLQSNLPIVDDEIEMCDENIETPEIELNENKIVHHQIQPGLSPTEMYCLSLAEPLTCMDIIERERVKFEIARIFKDARYIK